MDQFVGKLLSQIEGQGLSMSLTIVAVYYLYGKIKDCEADRKALWERLFEFMDDAGK